MEQRPKLPLKTIALIMFLLAMVIAGGSISTYYLYLVPKQNAEKLAFDKQKFQEDLRVQEEKNKSTFELEKQRFEAEQEEKESLKQSAEEKPVLEEKLQAQKEVALQTCQSEASLDYSNSWVNYCATWKKEVDKAWKDCRAKTYSWETDAENRQRCVSTTPDYTPSSSGSCMLPKRYSSVVDQNLKEQKDECYKKYELGLSSTSVSSSTNSWEAAYIKFDPFKFEKNKDGFYFVSGIVSRNCNSIYVTPKNTTNPIDETPYQLKTIYQPGDTTFSYNISASFRTEMPNAAVGLNEYTATAYCDGTPSVPTDTIQITFDENDL